MSESPQTATAALVDQVMRFMRTVHSMKAAGSRRDQASPERAAYSLLFPLLHKGNLRAGELADMVHSDPSTVSRHIAQLIDKGLVQRVPDQQDGRASLLALTNEGRELCDRLRHQRATLLAGLVSDWPENDLEDLTRLLGRLNDDMEAGLDEMVAGMHKAFESVQVLTADRPGEH